MQLLKAYALRQKWFITRCWKENVFRNSNICL